VELGGYYFDRKVAGRALTREEAEKARDACIRALRGREELKEALAGGREEELMAPVREELASILSSRGFYLTPEEMDGLAAETVRRMVGLGWLEPYLDPERFSEVALTPDGKLWVMPRGQIRFLDTGVRVGPGEAMGVIDRMLAPVARRVTEAEPVVSAKLPRSRRLPSGARVQVVVPPIANGDGPSLNVRLYTQKPVRPEEVAGWGTASPELLQDLGEAVRRRLRIMVAGGTGTGKTTLLSALCSYIPREDRIVLVEDPSEIFIDHPHVVSLEARPPNVEGRYGISAADLVTAAMRMTPQWLIVGEVRTGGAAVWLLRAGMSDHAGMSTVHAEDPGRLVDTLCILMNGEAGFSLEAARALIARGLDVVVRIGFHEGRRKVLGAYEVEEAGWGEIRFRPVWEYVGGDRWEKVDEWRRRR
jgi:pilus assembly protein CpaF